jgi:hypothetical protein
MSLMVLKLILMRPTSDPYGSQHVEVTDQFINFVGEDKMQALQHMHRVMQRFK